MADKGQFRTKFSSKAIADLLNQARDCNVITIANQEHFMEIVNEFFGEPNEGDADDMTYPATVFGEF